MELEDKNIKITFRQKKATECPICKCQFNKEELFTGRGRLIAGNLDNELRRSYQKNKKYGIIYPLIYPVIVCPECYYSAFPEDFDIPIKDIKSNIFNDRNNRENLVYNLFPNIDFNDSRTLKHGLLSYILSSSCYSFFSKKHAPSFKCGLSSLRVAWIANDLFIKTGDDKYNYIKKMFYSKAAYLYNQAVDFSQTGKELLDNIKTYGPDTDNNFGYDGMLYLASLLNFKIIFYKEQEKQAEEFIKSKRIVSRLFGSGKASKEKPSAILELSRKLFREINDKLKELNIDNA